MRTRRALFLASVVALGACNAILGNEEGVFAPGSAGRSSGGNSGRAGDSTMPEGGETGAGRAGSGGRSSGGTGGSAGTDGEAGEGGTAPRAGRGGGSSGRSGTAGSAGTSSEGCAEACEAPTPLCYLGECVACTPGTTPRCGAGETPETCVDGSWVSGASCADDSEACSNGVCVGKRLSGGLTTTSAVPGVTGIRLIEHGFEGGRAMSCGNAVCLSGGIRP